MKKLIAKYSKEKPWKLSKEEKLLTSNLKTMSVGDEQYDKTLKSIDVITRVRNSKTESAAKVAKDVATVVVMVGLGILAYGKDASDTVMRNKNTLGVFNKVFKI